VRIAGELARSWMIALRPEVGSARKISPLPGAVLLANAM
jgi:hypothetical protein